MEKFERSLGLWVIKYRWWIILINLAVVFLAASGVPHLHFTNNYRVFFSEDNPELLAFEAQENTYTKNDNVLFVIEPDDGNVFTRETLTAIAELTEQAWQVPYSNRVDSLSNFQHTEAEGDELIVQDLIQNASQLSDADLNDIRNIALSEPLLYKHLISECADVTGINVTVQLPRINETAENPDVVAAARKMASTIEQKYPHLKVRLTGMIMMNNAFTESSITDMQILVPISFAIMLFLLAVFVGSMLSTLGTLLVIAFSIITAMGTGGYLGFPITPPSASAPTIILTVAIANCVHILVTFLHSMRQGLEKDNALIESLRINLQPVFLASITTAIGFLMMNFSDPAPG
jgi:predicted RND superfamily exporter protein